MRSCMHTGFEIDKRSAVVARKTVMVSDVSGAEIQDGKGAHVVVKFNDLRKGIRELDMTDEEAEKLGGRASKRRGRKPAAAVS